MKELSDTVAYLSLAIFCIALIIAFVQYLRSRNRPEQKFSLTRSGYNPILSPHPDQTWENAAVFNPAALCDGQSVHLLYRALGGDGVSRIGYASSNDGIHFTRFATPSFSMGAPSRPKFQNPFAGSFRYNTDLYASGGGWGGSEDPRAVAIDGRIYMTFSVFENWESIRMAVTSMSLDDFRTGEWCWAPHFFISPAQETHKNWVLFPEKIHGKFALLHALTPGVLIDYTDSLEEWSRHPVRSNSERSGRDGRWDAFVRGAAAPPIKTEHGWLLLYHGMNPSEGPGYNVGAMLLDLDDPTKILYRSDAPILQPQAWYENDWKPGVVYASGAIVKDGTLFVYYGGGDKHVGVATAPFDEFLHALMKNGGTLAAP